MKKAFVGLMILTMARLLIPALSIAQETEDHQAIRALLDREQEGWETGDGAQILSCYAEGYVQYHVPKANGEPLFLETTIASEWLDGTQQKTLLAPDFVGFKEGLADTLLNAERSYEMSHIDIEGKEGVAIATFTGAWNDTLRNERVDVGWQSMWLLRKIDGQWKFVGAIGISGYRETRPLP